MSVRFLADADLNYAMVQGVRLREPAIDFKTANDARLEGLSDSEVLELAAGDGRVLVSHDKSTNAGPLRREGRGGPEESWSAAGVTERFGRRDR